MKKILFFIFLVLCIYKSNADTIIVEKATKRIKFSISDSIKVEFTELNIKFSTIVVSEFNSINSEIYHNVIVPDSVLNYHYVDNLFIKKDDYKLMLIKEQLKSNLLDLMMELSGLVTVCNNIYGDEKPQKLIDTINTIKSLRSVAINEIEALKSIKEANEYTLRGPVVVYLLTVLKNYIQ